MDYTNEQIKAAAEHCRCENEPCEGCPLDNEAMRFCREAIATRLLALESEASDLRAKLAESEKREKAAVADIKQSCDTCAHNKKQSCPWEGTYHHKGEHGEKIGVCNAWKWRGVQAEKE